MQQPQKKMNQRASHFVFGSTNQMGGSIYTQDYIRQQAEKDPNYKILDPFKGNSINPSNPSNFTTTNNAMLKNWGNVQKAGLDKEKLKDLRTHHFNLGSNDTNQSATTNQHYFNQKQITSDAFLNREEAKNRMRAHYHDFKQQPYTNFKSTYNKQFTGKEGDVAKNTKPEVTHNAIVFGNHNIPMVTTNANDFTKKQLTQNPVNKTLQQSSSLVLGDKPQSMQTMNQLYYGQKPIVKNQLPQATIKQLRNTHFNLGNLSVNFQTQMTSNYNLQPLSVQASFKNDTKFQSGTWVDKEAKFDGRTTNNRELPARKIQPFSRTQPKTKGQFHLGNQGNSYATQFSQNFNPKQAAYEGKAQKPKDNVTTGLDRGYYVTEHRANFKDRNLADAKVKVDIAALSKADHFQIGGTSKQDNISVFMDQYRRDYQNKSKLFHKDNQ